MISYVMGSLHRMFSIALRNADNIRRYSVSVHTRSGWEVTTEREGESPRRVVYRDWERVERTLALFRWEVSELTAHGWQRI